MSVATDHTVGRLHNTGLDREGELPQQYSAANKENHQARRTRKQMVEDSK